MHQCCSDYSFNCCFSNFQRRVSEVLWEVGSKAEKFASVCGVPYTALPIASVCNFTYSYKWFNRSDFCEKLLLQKPQNTLKCNESHY